MRKILNGFMILTKMNARPFCILALVVMPIDLQLKNNVIENVVFSGIKMFAIWKWTADPVLEGL